MIKAKFGVMNKVCVCEEMKPYKHYHGCFQTRGTGMNLLQIKKWFNNQKHTKSVRARNSKWINDLNGDLATYLAYCHKQRGYYFCDWLCEIHKRCKHYDEEQPSPENDEPSLREEQQIKDNSSEYGFTTDLPDEIGIGIRINTPECLC